MGKVSKATLDYESRARKSRNIIFAALVLAAFAVSLEGVSWSQQQPPQSQSQQQQSPPQQPSPPQSRSAPQSQSQQQAPPQSQSKISTEVKLVTVYASVRDKHGKII